MIYHRNWIATTLVLASFQCANLDSFLFRSKNKHFTCIEENVLEKSLPAIIFTFKFVIFYTAKHLHLSFKTRLFSLKYHLRFSLPNEKKLYKIFVSHINCHAPEQHVVRLQLLDAHSSICLSPTHSCLGPSCVGVFSTQQRMDANRQKESTLASDLRTDQSQFNNTERRCHRCFMSLYNERTDRKDLQRVGRFFTNLVMIMKKNDCSVTFH